MPFPLAVKLELSRQSQHSLSWLSIKTTIYRRGK
jgi:hypothetical protein